MKVQSIFSAPASSPTDLSKADEPTLLNMCDRILGAALAAEPAVTARFDDVDPAVCLASELIELIELCQSRELKTYFYSIFLYRESMALASGRSFGRVDGSIQ